MKLLPLVIKNVVRKKLVRWLVEQGVALEEVRREWASFEEAFLDLVDTTR